MRRLCPGIDFAVIYPVVFLLAILSFALPCRGWTEFTEEELTMTPPDWCKDADAMILTKGKWCYPGKYFSINHFTLRIKIFTDKGKNYGNVFLEIPFLEFLNTSKMKGRTITPEGKEIKVDMSKAFSKTLAEKSGRDYAMLFYEVAFPEVTAGAILELNYETTGFNFAFVPPYYFNYPMLPTQNSIFAFSVPQSSEYAFKNLNTAPYHFQTGIEEITTATGKNTQFIAVTSKIDIDLKKPFSPPPGFARPHIYFVYERERYLLSTKDIVPDWKAAVKIISDEYAEFLRGKKHLKSVYAQIVADTTDTAPLEERLFRWVCDSLETVNSRHYLNVG